MDGILAVMVRLSTIKHLLLSFVFCSGAILILIGLGFLYQPSEPYFATWSELLYEDHGPLDVIVLGNSHAQNSYSPLQAYQEYGIASWTIGSGSITTPTKYAYAQTVISREHPKVLAVELFGVTRDVELDPAQNIRAYYGMPLNGAKIAAMLETAHKNQLPELLMPILPAPTRKFSLSHIPYISQKSDAGAIALDDDESNLVFLPTPSPNQLQAQKAIEAYQISYLKKIADLCRETDTQLLFFFAPTLEALDYGSFESIRQQVTSLYPEVKFLNSNDSLEDIQLTKSDFATTSHMNYRGQEKFTRWFGAQIKHLYPSPAIIPDRRNQQHAAWWESNYDRWINQLPR